MYFTRFCEPAQNTRVFEGHAHFDRIFTTTYEPPQASPVRAHFPKTCIFTTFDIRRPLRSLPPVEGLKARPDKENPGPTPFPGKIA